MVAMVNSGCLLPCLLRHLLRCKRLAATKAREASLPPCHDVKAATVDRLSYLVLFGATDGTHPQVLVTIVRTDVQAITSKWQVTDPADANSKVAPTASQPSKAALLMR